VQEEAMTEFEEIKAEFDKDAADFHPYFPGDLGAALGILDNLCVGKKVRHEFQLKLTGCASVNEMTEGQKWALVRFVMPKKIDGKWVAEQPEIVLIKVLTVLVESPA
jgi:hypothetical protein